MRPLPTILYRRPVMDRDELAAAARYFPVAESRVGLRDTLVIGRYSVVPFYHEVARDLALQGSRLINTKAEHDYIANFEYYHDLGPAMTPRTYFRLQDVPKDGGPFVVKGVTNSKKAQWATKMFAPTYLDTVRIASELATDHYLGSQDIIVREYVPLRQLAEGLEGLPISHEWRCFFYRDQLLAAGFYWPDCDAPGPFPPAAAAKAHEAARMLAAQTTFFVVDVAETAAGDWIVIEVNDGQMSGLSEVEADTLYRTLAEAIRADQSAGDVHAP